MTVEMTLLEAELLIALLTGADGAFAVIAPPLARALDELRPWRSALLQAYLRERHAFAKAAGAERYPPFEGTDVMDGDEDRP